MHFFNPSRYMKLLELVAGPETDARRARAASTRFGEDVLGKGIVVGKDTPNFVGNRIGVHAMMATIHLMLEEGLAPEDVDAITGAPMGAPARARASAPPTWSASTPSSTSPTTATTTLTDDEEREVFKVPAYIRDDGREEAARRQDQGRLLQARPARTSQTLDSEDARVPRQGRRRGDREGDARRSPRSRTRASACKKLRRRPGRGRRVRVEGALAQRSPTRRAASARSPTTSTRSMTR